MGTTATQGTQWRVPNGALARVKDKVYVLVKSATGFRAVSVTLVDESARSAVVSGDLGSDPVIAVEGVAALKGRLLDRGK